MTNIEYGFPDAQLLKVEMFDDYYEQIVQFSVTKKASEELTTSQENQLVLKVIYFQLIAGQLYKLGPDEILR